MLAAIIVLSVAWFLVVCFTGFLAQTLGSLEKRLERYRDGALKHSMDMDRHTNAWTKTADGEIEAMMARDITRLKEDVSRAKTDILGLKNNVEWNSDILTSNHLINKSIGYRTRANHWHMLKQDATSFVWNLIGLICPK